MISIMISIGELCDRTSILKIKYQRIQHGQKMEEAYKQHTYYHAVKEQHLKKYPESVIQEVRALEEELLETNDKLWVVEDDLRTKENEEKFDDEFITLARSVYYLNDKRNNIKSKINSLLDDQLSEVKEYAKYGA